MRMARVFLSISIPFSLCISLVAQQTATTVQRDPQALAVLQQAVAVGGGSTLLGSIQDFTATGSITYLWIGNQVQGTATIRALATTSFRVDANLPQGTRSLVASYGSGTVRNTDGSLVTIPSNNTVNLGALTFPLLKVAAALNNTSLSIQYLSLTNLSGHQVHVIHVQQGPPSSTDIISHLSATDFLIDATTYQILLVRDAIHPSGVTQDILHEIEFSDFRPTSGCLVPFSITERVGGQQTWTVHLSAISFNTSLTDADFQL
jgi:hypothetical protein